MKKSHDLDVLISKVESINTRLGGSKTQAKKENDEFTSIKTSLSKLIESISTQQDERDKRMDKIGRDVTLIKQNADIRDLITEAGRQLDQMNDILRRQRKNPKKYPQNQVEVKDKQYNNYKEMVRQLNNREDGGVMETQQSDTSFTEFKIKANTGRVATYAKRDLTQQEQDALERFKEKDRELDALVDKINDGLDGLKGKAERIGEQLDQQEIGVKDLEIEIDKTSKTLANANTQLKKILFEYKKPSSICMDVICLLILLGLIGIIIKLAQS